ncbi:hypothetical protein OTB20_06170 [Streptomyces sp. H27-H1]|uniref:hypothetical protein n=1 Tax=Streptomyces sp. H27-H1 TaxID=2996461 RepID=UPI0022700892|nr:hypothetical protein [Streptomyces sp. H27-H1]MCY0925795.1 hypothetical protein [Streptomyces sp. H27-H1]
MARISRKHRLTMFALSATFVGGGALLPTSAFAAPATPHPGDLAASAATRAETNFVNESKGGWGGWGEQDGVGKRTNGHKNNKKRGNQPRDVENMPGCKFVSGKVYCEVKPDPKPAEPKPEIEVRPGRVIPGPGPFVDPATGADTRGKAPK